MTQLLKYTGGNILKGLGHDGAESARAVSGYYTSSTVDLQGHMIDKNAMLAALGDYRQWGTVREMHETPIGVTRSIGESEWNFIEAEIANTAHGDEVLSLIAQGIYKAFSVGILVTNGEFVPFTQIKTEELEGLPLNMVELFREIGDIFKITGITLVEVSVVDRPANPLARVQSVQNELGATFDGILPAIQRPKAIDAIKGVIRSSGIYVPVTSAIFEALHADSDISSTVTMKETNKMEVTVSDTVEKELEDTATGATDESLVADDAVDTSAEVAVKSETGENLDVVDTNKSEGRDAFLTAASEVLESVKALTEAVHSIAIEKDAFAETVAAAVVAALKQAETQSSESEEEVTEEAAKFVTFDAEQIKSLVDQIVAGVTEVHGVRKGAVNDPTQTKEDAKPEINIKQLSTDQLGKLIANRAVRSI